MTMQNTDLGQQLHGIQQSAGWFMAEGILVAGIVFVLIIGLILPGKKPGTVPILYGLAALVLLAAASINLAAWGACQTPRTLFGQMLEKDRFALYLSFLFDLGGLFTLFMSRRKHCIPRHHTEYACLILAIVLGAHLLTMSTNFIIVFIALELISISSYVLTSFSFHKNSAEGSLKYFLFGAVASAFMLYGFSLLYGITGSLTYTDAAFTEALAANTSPLVLLASFLAMAGFLYKAAAVPMHIWAPDVYEAAPLPIVALFSVVPKLAGLGILTRFMQALHPVPMAADWQQILAVVVMLTITVGNFSALKQKSPKRMMAYSSIAQSGFLLIGVLVLMPQGITFLCFYGTVYLLANFVVFSGLQHAEEQRLYAIQNFNGTGKAMIWCHVLMLVGFISLTGLPPTAGFTAKLFIFSALWEAYAATEKIALLVTLVWGLINTVVALFYYLRIPFLAFFKTAPSIPAHIPADNGRFTKLFGLILVILILLLFFQPSILMHWINTVNFEL